MKRIILLLLIFSIILIGWRFSKPTAHFIVNNISQVEKAGIKIFIDGKIVFDKLVENSIDKNKSRQTFEMKLARGKHFIEVVVDNGSLLQKREFVFNRDNSLIINYNAVCQVNPYTNKRLEDGSLSRNLSLAIE